MSTFSEHLKSHSDPAKKRGVPDPGTSRTCSKCNYLAPTALHYTNHLKLHASDPEKRAHKCLLCDAAFAKRTSLHIHVIRKHPKRKGKAKVSKKASAKTPVEYLRKLRPIRTTRIEMPELSVELNEMEMDCNSSNSHSQSEPPELDLEEDGSNITFEQNGQNGYALIFIFEQMIMFLVNNIKFEYLTCDPYIVSSITGKCNYYRIIFFLEK